MSELEDFRNEKDDFFQQDLQSPLTADQKKEFQGIELFP